MAPSLTPASLDRAAPGHHRVCPHRGRPDDAIGVSVHWVLYGVPVSVRELPEGVPRQGTVAGVGTQGLNDFGGTGYKRKESR